MELENKKGFGWPPVGLRLLWLCPLWTSPWWLRGVCPKPRAGPGSVSCGSCGLWLQTWGIFTPRDTAAPWDTSRGCRKGCRKLFLRLVLPWNVGRALGLSLFWVIPGNPGCSCSPLQLRDGNSLDCSPAPRAAPGLLELLSVLSLLLGCVSCLNIPGEEFSHVGTPGHSRWMHCRNSQSQGRWAEPVDPKGLPMLRSMFISMFSPLKPVFVTGLCCMDTGNVCGPGCVSRVFPAPAWGTGSLPCPVALGTSFSKQH